MSTFKYQILLRNNLISSGRSTILPAFSITMATNHQLLCLKYPETMVFHRGCTHLRPSSAEWAWSHMGSQRSSISILFNPMNHHKTGSLIHIPFFLEISHDIPLEISPMISSLCLVNLPKKSIEKIQPSCVVVQGLTHTLIDKKTKTRGAGCPMKLSAVPNVKQGHHRMINTTLWIPLVI